MVRKATMTPYSRHMGQRSYPMQEQRARWDNISFWCCTVGSDRTWGSLSKAWLHYAPKCRHRLETLLTRHVYLVYTVRNNGRPSMCCKPWWAPLRSTSSSTIIEDLGMKKNNPWWLSIYLGDGGREEDKALEKSDGVEWWGSSGSGSGSDSEFGCRSGEREREWEEKVFEWRQGSKLVCHFISTRSRMDFWFSYCKHKMLKGKYHWLSVAIDHRF
jgi:hypothetical protein